MKKNLTIIFSANAFMLLSGVLTSLLGAWALGPDGRGDLAVIVLWPNVVALLAGMGLPQAHRYFMAREPALLSAMYSNAALFAAGAGALALALAEYIVPALVGARSPAVLWLVRLYLLNIPLALLSDLMLGFLEGARQFRPAALTRMMFFGVQSLAYLILWAGGALTVRAAALTMIAAQLANTVTVLLAVRLTLRPQWRPSRDAWKKTIGYGIRYHPGVLTAFTTLRLDQLMLAGMAGSAAIGLYVIAVRLSEITTVLASSVSDVLMPEVAASGDAAHSLRLLTRSLRQTLYGYLLVLGPLWVGAPWLLAAVYGPGFLEAAGVLRLLLIASLLWSGGSIIISGLNGLGHPGLSTMARLLSAAVTAPALWYWLPRRGIEGAALASILGYTVMSLTALFWLVRRQDVSLWECLMPQRDDLPGDQFLRRIRWRFGL